MWVVLICFNLFIYSEFLRVPNSDCLKVLNKRCEGKNVFIQSHRNISIFINQLFHLWVSPL